MLNEFNPGVCVKVPGSEPFDCGVASVRRGNMNHSDIVLASLLAAHYLGEQPMYVAAYNVLQGDDLHASMFLKPRQLERATTEAPIPSSLPFAFHVFFLGKHVHSPGHNQ